MGQGGIEEKTRGGRASRYGNFLTPKLGDIRLAEAYTREWPFNALASVFDAWFGRERNFSSPQKLRCFGRFCHCYPKPGLKGSGRRPICQVLEVEGPAYSSVKLLWMTRRCGITGFFVREEEQFFHDKIFGVRCSRL